LNLLALVPGLQLRVCLTTQFCWLQVVEEAEIPPRTLPAAAEALEATSPLQALQFLAQSLFKLVLVELVRHQPPVSAGRVETQLWVTLWSVEVVEERASTHPQPHLLDAAAVATSLAAAVVVLEELT
jgi:hypothetical protein